MDRRAAAPPLLGAGGRARAQPGGLPRPAPPAAGSSRAPEESGDDERPRTGGVPYVELHCHSAYSFLDGVSLPHELARRASELGHTAIALTDHNSVSGSMELAQVAADHGVRAIHGAELDVTVERDHASAGSAGSAWSAGRRVEGGERGDAGSGHLTLLVRDERGWRNLCRILTLAHAHTREGSARRERAEPSVDVQAVIDHAEGLVCLTGCAGRSAIARASAGGRSRPRRAHRRTAARRVRPAGPVCRAAAPVRPSRSRAQPSAGGARPAPGGRVRGDRQRPRARARQGRAAGCVRGARQPRHARCLRAAAPRQPQSRDEHAAGDGQPLRRPSRRRPRDAAAGRAADVRSDQGSRLPLPGGRGRRAPRAAWPSCAARGCRSATRRVPAIACPSRGRPARRP